ncbi:MAG: DUF2164 domain-containing protein [Calditrichota bacterium]
MPIQLKDDIKDKLIASLQRYFDEELDMEIGELKSELILDYLMQEAGAVIYNQAIRNAQAYITDRADDMDGTLYHPEFTYWEK